ncbi:MAG TPA: hypothetical protein VFU05_01435 [Cyclobacteriaceae bacterium]|nr:hypothetical protein [Cyclobacteriaceae bacterium]
MEKQTNLGKSILVVAAVTALILIIPLVAMQFTSDVNWSVSDFTIMGVLIFATGLSFVLVMRYAINMIYRIAMIMAFGTTFLLVWANLAVGLIGSGPHWGNLMYLGVYGIVIIGSIRSRFASGNMERVMYVAAVALVIVAAIAIFANMGAYPGSSVNEIIAVNGFFATLFAIAGALFRIAGEEKSIEKSGA